MKRVLFHATRGLAEHPGWLPWAVLSALFVLAGRGSNRGVAMAAALSLGMLTMILVTNYQRSKVKP